MVKRYKYFVRIYKICLTFAMDCSGVGSGRQEGLKIPCPERAYGFDPRPEHHAPSAATAAGALFFE